MDDVIRQAVTDLLTLCKDAERIQRIVKLLQSNDAHDEYAMRWRMKLPR